MANELEALTSYQLTNLPSYPGETVTIALSLSAFVAESGRKVEFEADPQREIIAFYST